MADFDAPPTLQNTPAMREIEPRKQPPGTVERILNIRERSYVVAVCAEFLKKSGGGHKTQIRIARVKEVVAFPETIEYIDMIEDAYDEKRFQWRRAVNSWNNWRKYQEGSLSLEDLHKVCPTMDPAAIPEKPHRRQPEATYQELRGPERACYFPSKLDAWVQDCLKASTWEGVLPEYVAELCGKFGIGEE